MLTCYSRIGKYTAILSLKSKHIVKIIAHFILLICSIIKKLNYPKPKFINPYFYSPPTYMHSFIFFIFLCA